jgi:hypothetical protein
MSSAHALELAVLDVAAERPRSAAQTARAARLLAAAATSTTATLTSCRAIHAVCALHEPAHAVALALRLACASNTPLCATCAAALQPHGAVLLTGAALQRRYRVFDPALEDVPGAALARAWYATCSAAERAALRSLDAWLLRSAVTTPLAAVVDAANCTGGGVAAAAADVLRDAACAALWVVGARVPRPRSVPWCTSLTFVVGDAAVDDDVVWLFAALMYGAADVRVVTGDRCRNHVARLPPRAATALALWLQRHTVPRALRRVAQRVDVGGGAVALPLPAADVWVVAAVSSTAGSPARS